MTPSTLSPRARLLLTILVVMAYAPLAWAQVRDSTGLFSSQAVQQADSAIQQMRQQYGKDLLIETVPEIPAELRDQFNSQPKGQFFQTWAASRARDLKVNGIYVLISRDPSHLEVAVGNQTQKQAFTLQNRDQLASTLLSHFRNRQYDQGLLAGTQYVQQTMRQNLARGPAAAAPVRNQASRSTGWGLGTCFWVGLIGLGVILLISYLRRRRAAAGYGYGPGQYGMARGPYGGQPGNYPPPGAPGPYPPGYGGYGAPGAGGGFGRGLFGGLLGGLGGGWLYDKLSGRPHDPNQAWGAGPGATPPSGPPSSPDTDFSSGGGDFGPPDSGGGGGGGGGSGGDF